MMWDCVVVLLVLLVKLVLVLRQFVVVCGVCRLRVRHLLVDLRLVSVVLVLSVICRECVVVVVGFSCG